MSWKLSMSLNAYILLSLADCIVAYQRQGFEMNSLRFPRIWCLLEFENGERMGSSPSIYSYIYICNGIWPSQSWRICQACCGFSLIPISVVCIPLFHWVLSLTQVHTYHILSPSSGSSKLCHALPSAAIPMSSSPVIVLHRWHRLSVLRRLEVVITYCIEQHRKW